VDAYRLQMTGELCSVFCSWKSILTVPSSTALIKEQLYYKCCIYITDFSGIKWKEFLRIKLIKNYLTSKLHNRFFGFATISFENNVAMKLMFEGLHDFASMKVRKVTFI
jgi:hypothetical protein